ncbi:MAG: 50S ribosomal protein L11 methyltransferase [Chitinophagales bacterium]
MQEYRIVHFSNTKAQNDILIALLNDLSFDSYEEPNENELKAYILELDFNASLIEETLASLEIFEGIQFTHEALENKNWNALWEKNFEAIQVGGICEVRAPFHASSGAKYDLVIEPKMAFGTGHHATTKMVIELMLELDFKGKKVLDFGCGTGILAILAEKLGAESIEANDIEFPAFENTMENAALNHCKSIHALYGDIHVVPKTSYDTILANVTTLTIQENLLELLQLLTLNGNILLSGILAEQKDIVLDLAKSLKLILISEKMENNWVALHFQKAN